MVRLTSGLGESEEFRGVLSWSLLRVLLCLRGLVLLLVTRARPYKPCGLL